MAICVLVWDAKGLPPQYNSTLVLWRGFATRASPSAISIPKLIEDNADVLRARYLAWIYDLGEARIDGKRVIDNLELRPQFSYWWMTAIVEKCNFAHSPHISDAIKLMALDDWAKGLSVSSVVLTSGNQPLAECMRLWCATRGVPFEWQQIDNQPNQNSDLSLVRRIFWVLPQFLRALAYFLYYLVERWPLRGAGLKEWQQTQGKVTFISYLFNLTPDAAKAGQYESRYWAHLPTVLLRDEIQTNWLHLYLKSSLLPTATKAASIIREFNLTYKGEQVHATLDTFLSVSIALRTLSDWCKLVWRGKVLEPTLSTVKSNGLGLWPLYKHEWSESLRGLKSITNLLYLNLFQTALSALPKQRVGIYLYEQQSWELSLIHTWRFAGHASLIGAQHATMLYWDLRYFHDPRNYKRSGCNDLPLPQEVAVNGPKTMSTSLQAGYPKERLVEVEALRYLHLGKAKADAGSDRVPSNMRTKDELRLLVLGDYLLINTQRQMNLLAQSIKSLPTNVVITVKPHPNCMIHSGDYPSLNMTITMEPIAKLLAECDVAYSSAATSAAVDAYCAGVPIVSLQDPTSLNLSPLRGCAGALFASTPEELVQSLNVAMSASPSAELVNVFFTINQTLPRWRKLILSAI